MVHSAAVGGTTKREVVTAFRTGEILAAAHAVFAARGFDGATIADIAEAAGVAKGTVYLDYRSKREVYWATLERDLIDLGERLAAALTVADGVAAKVRAFIATKLAHFDANRDFFRIYFGAFGHPAGRAAASAPGLDRHIRQQVGALESILRQAAERGEIRAIDPAATAFAIFDLTRGVITQRLRGWSQRELEDDVSQLFNLVWRGIAAS